MSSTSDFIAELVRAANEGDRLGLYEKVRLLDRAVTTIRKLREQVGIPSSGSSADGIVDLLTSKPATAGRARTGERIKHAFLDAASTIRTLHIVLGHRLPSAQSFTDAHEACYACVFEPSSAHLSGTSTSEKEEGPSILFL